MCTRQKKRWSLRHVLEPDGWMTWQGCRVRTGFHVKSRLASVSQVSTFRPQIFSAARKNVSPVPVRLLWVFSVYTRKACTVSVRDGICVDPPLCCGPSQGMCGLRFIVFICEGETVGKIGEVDEKGKRELVLVVSQVRQGMRHDTWMTIVLWTQMKCDMLYLWVYCSQ